MIFFPLSCASTPKRVSILNKRADDNGLVKGENYGSHRLRRKGGIFSKGCEAFFHPQHGEMGSGHMQTMKDDFQVLTLVMDGAPQIRGINNRFCLKTTSFCTGYVGLQVSNTSHWKCLAGSLIDFSGAQGTAQDLEFAGNKGI